MNWDAIGSIGEIVGAIAVVASVMYLAVQVRKQTEESRLGATRALADRYDELLSDLMADETMIALHLEATADFNCLPNEKRMRISILYQRITRNLEQQFLHRRGRNIEEGYTDSILSAFQEFLCLPSVKQWWELNSHNYDVTFRNYLEAMLNEAQAKGYNSTFKTAAKESEANS